jgi:hypothetical protein
LFFSNWVNLVPLRRGPAAEAFYKNRAKLLKQQQQRKQKQDFKDPIKRMEHFQKVAAGAAAGAVVGAIQVVNPVYPFSLEPPGLFQTLEPIK